MATQFVPQECGIINVKRFMLAKESFNLKQNVKKEQGVAEELKRELKKKQKEIEDLRRQVKRLNEENNELTTKLLEFKQSNVQLQILLEVNEDRCYNLQQSYSSSLNKVNELSCYIENQNQKRDSYDDLNSFVVH